MAPPATPSEKGAGALRLKTCAAAAILLSALAACGEREVILPGERLDVRAGFEAAADTGTGAVPPLSLSRQTANDAWTQRNGSALHRIAHPALAPAPAPLWSVDIGQGATRKHRITAAPVIVGGCIFTLDAQAGVMAHDATTGATLWARDLTPASDKAADASGGALTLADGRLYVTTGFGALHALDAATGAPIWTQKLDAPMTGGATLSGGVVYTVSRDGRAWALESETGRIRWELPGVPAPALIVGGASPVVTDRLVVFPFGNGDLVAALKRNGIRVWQAGVSGQRVGVARAGITDITGDPVVAGDRLYVGSHAGRLVAFDLASGERIWTADIGALGPVWPEGGSLFVISDTNRLVRVDSSTGASLWSVELPGFLRDNRRSTRWQEVVAHYGPVLAGGQVYVASNDGLVRRFDPETGAESGVLRVTGGATTPPVVAGGRLYVVTDRGQLHAFQ